jgi:protein-S-isoprenylcysteine O-methyltransferase Ste14
MALQEQFEKTGNLFFRWRSYLPLAMALLFLLALAAGGGRAGASGAWEFCCLAVSLAGQVLRFFTVGFVPAGTSGRNTRGQVADTLNTTGMYSVVRNPLYLGNAVIWLGLSLLLQFWWLTLIVALSFIIFYERIIFAEERFLQEKFGDAFAAWAEETPVILPRWRHYRRPALPFSWKSAINREYATFFAIVSSFTVLVLLRDSLAAGRIAFNSRWLAIFLASAAIYGCIRFLKKKTRLLATADR